MPDTDLRTLPVPPPHTHLHQLRGGEFHPGEGEELFAKIFERGSDVIDLIVISGLPIGGILWHGWNSHGNLLILLHLNYSIRFHV